MPESNSLEDSGIKHADTTGRTLDWADPELVRITRIRFVGDSWRGPFDLSYVLGTDTQDRQVRVQIPAYQIMGDGGSVVRELVTHAKREGVYLKRLCGGDISDVVSVCW